MMIRGSQLSLLIAFLGSAAFVVSCSTPSRATSSANHDVTSATPHLVTVLQAEG